MKKLIASLLVLLCTAVYSQTEYRIYKINYGPKNEYTGNYDTKEESADMRMVFDNSVVRIYDEARSVYIVTNHQEIKDDSEGAVAKWDAKDERGRNVGIFMVLNRKTGEQSLAVAYSDFMFQYFFTRK